MNSGGCFFLKFTSDDDAFTSLVEHISLLVITSERDQLNITLVTHDA